MYWKQSTLFPKANVIWESKGELYLAKDKYLTLLEVDYLCLLVLVNKEDYIAFEKKYYRLQKLSKITNKQ